MGEAAAPQAVRKAGRFVLGRGDPGDRPDRRDVEDELPGQGLGHGVRVGPAGAEPVRGELVRAEYPQPGVAPLVRGRGGDVKRDGGSVQARPRFAAGQQQSRAGPGDKPCHRRSGTFILARCRLVRVQVEHQRHQQALPLPDPGYGFQVLGVARQQVGGQRQRGEAEPSRGFRGHLPLGAPVGAQQRHDRLLAGPPRSHYLVGHGPLRGRQAFGIRDERREQRFEPVIEVVQALDVVDDAFIGLQRTGQQRQTSRAGDVDQSPVPQRPPRREHVPGRVGQDGQCEREGRVRVTQGLCAQCADGGVECGADAQEERVAFESGQSQQAPEQDQSRWWIVLLGDCCGQCGGLHLLESDPAVWACGQWPRRRLGCRRLGGCRKATCGVAGWGPAGGPASVPAPASAGAPVRARLRCHGGAAARRPPAAGATRPVRVPGTRCWPAPTPAGSRRHRHGL